MATDPEMVAGLRQGSFELSGTFDGDLSRFFPPPLPRQLNYVVPHRPRWWRRWEIVEYTGQVVPAELTQAPDGDFSAGFTATGQLTKTVHPRRFWLLWSVNRYLRRLKTERGVSGE